MVFKSSAILSSSLTESFYSSFYILSSLTFNSNHPNMNLKSLKDSLNPKFIINTIIYKSDDFIYILMLWFHSKWVISRLSKGVFYGI
jgi:hypothetical protein